MEEAAEVVLERIQEVKVELVDIIKEVEAVAERIKEVELEEADILAAGRRIEAMKVAKVQELNTIQPRMEQWRKRRRSLCKMLLMEQLESLLRNNL